MSHKEHQKIIRRPIVSEKTNVCKEEDNQYTFEVDKSANKIEIRKAVEALFSVNVLDVSTMIIRGKMKRVGRRFGKQKNWKKAVVKLRKGDTIDFFAGV